MAHLLEHWELEPELVQRGLGVIARNVAAFGRCALEEVGSTASCSLPTAASRPGSSEDGYRALAMPHDRAALAALRPGALLMLHIHGERGSYSTCSRTTTWTL